MPRAYVRKRETKYTLDDLQKAVKDVEEKKKTYRQAQEAYNVPIAVIYHRIKGRKININRMGAGISKVLSDRIEGHIVSCLKVRAQGGHPVLKEELKLMVKEYVETKKVKTPFTDDKPGDDWYTSFMKRHPELSLKKPEHLQKARKDARKPYVVYSFYDLLNKIVEENFLKNKPMYIYNCDESGFQSDPSKMRAIGQKGKPLYRVSGGSGRESTTVLACVSADGQALPPLIVFKGAAVQARWTSDKALPGTLYAATKNGWMEEPVFFNWLVKSFIPHVVNLRQEKNEPDQKALLIYDGHASHISVRIVEEAEKANIVLLKFPSHLTDRIQPLDKCVFGPVKKQWDKKFIEHGVKQMGQGSGRLTRTQFAELLGEVYVTALKPQNIISGFTTTGLYPVDPSKFPKNLFSAQDLKLYNALFENDQDDRQLTEKIDEEQLDIERFYREQIVYQNDHQTKMRNEQIEEDIEKEISLQSEQIDLQNEDVTVQIDKIAHKHLHEKIQTRSESPRKRKMDEQLEKVLQTNVEKEQVIGQKDETDTQEEKDKEYKQDTSNTQEEKDKENKKHKDILRLDTQTEKNLNENTEKENIERDDNFKMNKIKIRTTDQQTKIWPVDNELQHADIFIEEIVEKEQMETEQIDPQNEKIDTEINHIAQKQTYEQKKKFKNNNEIQKINGHLINNILKMISLDTSTTDENKSKIISALSSTLNEKNNYETPEQSPNKGVLQKIFGVCTTPVKAKKPVVARLKQSAFGEILTSEEVKERLRLAEEKKVKTKKKDTKKLIDITNEPKLTNNNDKQIKGKGKGKKSKAKKITDKIVLVKTKTKKRKVESEDSESEIEMSTHSDSDIADVVSDVQISDYEEINSKEKASVESIPTSTCVSPVAGNSKPKEPEVIIDYNIHDNVLVRYFLKHRVEYYVGKVIHKTTDKYKVSFYKRSGRNDNTKFTVSKKDVDCVLPNMIVKNVNLLALNEKETQFVLLDDEDSVYFD